MVAFTLAAIAALSGFSAVPASELAEQDIEKFQGTWVAVSAEADGKKLPAEAVKDFAMVIEGNKITFNPGTEGRQSTFELDPAKLPKQIILTPLDGPGKGKSQRGLYAFEDGQLKFLVNNDPNGIGGVPTGFATHRGDGLRLLVLKPALSRADDDE